MNNEFKKLSQGDVTRYILENASGGGTSSGSVASVSMPMGGMQRRKGDNLIAQESDKKKVPASTPRNFVAKNAKTAGAGAHKDKSKTIPRKEKHKKPFMEDHSTATGGWGQGSYDTYTAGNHGRGVAEEGDVEQELGMAGSELYGIAKHAKELLALIQQHSDEQGLEAWQQSKITKAADYLTSVLQSIDYDTNGDEQGVAEGAELKKAKRSMNQAAKDANTDQVGAGKKIDTMKKSLRQKDVAKQGVAEEWSQKYKSSINCSHPKGFSQKAHCAGKKKHNESMEMESVCPDCGMCEAHGNNKIYDKCWTGFRKVPGKARGEQGSCKKIGEGEENRCMQCGMTNCTCAPGKCKCKPVAGWVPGKGFRKASSEKSVAEGNLEEKAPPGMEAEVLRLKKQYPGHPEKAFATAWSIYNKKHGKTENADAYFESLQQMVERQLEPTMDLDTWVDNFQNADPNKYHQFKNKTPEKKK